ncbi:MAG: hypothetical protein AB7P20_23120 [Rhizobiaceae bacterium]
MTSTLLASLALVVVLSHLLAAWSSSRNTGLSPDQARRFTFRVAIVLGVLLAASAAVSTSGFLANFDATPPYLMRFILPHVVFTLIIGTISPYGRRLALGLPIAALVGLQAFRIPVEFLLHEFYREGLAPIQVTYLDRNLDVLTGVTAIPVAWLAASGKAPRWLLFVWNWLGLALLLNVVGVALTSMPGPFRLFMNEPSARFIADFPYIFVPTVFVTTALFGHVLLFRRLHLEAKAAAPVTREMPAADQYPS